MNIYYNLEAINRIRWPALVLRLFSDQSKNGRKFMLTHKPEFFWEGEKNTHVLSGKMVEFAKTLNQMSPGEAKAYLAFLHLENVAQYEVTEWGSDPLYSNLLYSYEFSPGVGKQWVVVFVQLRSFKSGHKVFRIFLPHAVFDE